MVIKIVEYVLIALFCLFILGVFVVMPIAIYLKVFGRRQDKNEKLKYFTAEDFALKFKKLDINYCGITLNGGIYSIKNIEECDKLIIFSHGMGAGHEAYTTEIAYFANQGYAVLAYDNYGCGASGGKGIRGFYAGAEAVIAAYIAIKSDSALKDKKVYLVGHSWGAYSVLCAAKKIDVSGVVAFSPFNSPVKIVRDFAKQYNAFVAALSAPAAWLVNLCRFGVKGNGKAVKAIQKSNTPALVIWGEKDAAVTKNNSVACLADSANVTCIIEKDKAHNPYNTVEAEKKLGELLQALGGKYKTEEELNEFLSAFDWKAATEEDLTLMGKVCAFIESC